MTASRSNRSRQCKKWEKDRRNRLNESFTALAKLLPCYEPSLNISKIEILTKSAEYIIKLKSNVADSLDDEIKELHLKILYLTARNEQFSSLLKDANITIPPECGGPITDKPKKWSGKITPEKAQEINKSEAQKENKNVDTNQKKPTQCKVKPIKLQEKRKKVKQKVKTLKSLNTITPINTITNVQPIQPYYIITNNITPTITTQSVVTTQSTTVQNGVATPLFPTTNQPCKTITSGIILPVMQPQALLNPPLLLNPATAGSTLIVVKTNKAHASQAVDSLPTIKAGNPKSTTKSLRKLTLLKPKRRVMARIGNKLPIPASKYESSSSFVLWSNSAVQPTTTTTVRHRAAKVTSKRKPTKTTNDEDKSSVAAATSCAESSEIAKAVDAEPHDTAKKQSSDYSINAICKESECPTSKDIEKVINEVVEKATPTAKDTPMSKQTDGEQQHSQNVNNTSIAKESTNQDKVAAGKNVGLHMEKPLAALPQNGAMSQLHASVPDQFHGHLLGLKDEQTAAQTHHHQQPQVELQLHAELSDDLFASLQHVQAGNQQQPESTSPTAAFLNAFPLVSSFAGVKVTEVLGEEAAADSPHADGTPTLLQIGNVVDAVAAQKTSTATDASMLASGLVGLDGFNFFTGNNLYGGGFDNNATTSGMMAASNNAGATPKPTTKVTEENTSSHCGGKKHVQAKASSSSHAKPFAYDGLYDNGQRAVVSSGIGLNATTNHHHHHHHPHHHRYNEYNTFNPFELPKGCGEPAYANGSNCSYGYHQPTEYNYQLGKNNYYDANNCSFYAATGTNNTVNSGGHVATQSAPTSNALASSSSSSKYAKRTKDSQANNNKMVNWMAPEFAASTAAKVTSYSDLGQNAYLYANDYPNTGGVDDHQHHQFAWSPTKLPQLLDTAQHFPPSTLPTLVGDLALGIGADAKRTKSVGRKSAQGYEPSILSVSQLVEHSKETTPATAQRVANRRSSGNRSTAQKAAPPGKGTPKRHRERDEWTEAKRSKHATPLLGSYSAESLIAAKQQSNGSGNSSTSYPKTIPPYLPDNILPYFPPHNLDENGQPYQGNGFAPNYNNTFMPPPPSATATYLPEVFDAPVENIFSHVHPPKSSHHARKMAPKTSNVTAAMTTTAAAYPNTGGGSGSTGAKSSSSKSRKKETAFVDLSFLAMPSINSPLLPEDFHTTFLPPPAPPNPNPTPSTLYASCKNPINTLPLGGVAVTAPPPAGIVSDNSAMRTRAIHQHTDISPAPSSLTNFNLCTIFPEINRTNSVVPDVFRNYGNNSTQKSTNFLPNLE